MVGILISCMNTVTSAQDALKYAEKEIPAIQTSNGVPAGDLKLINITENQEIKGWEVYYENSNKTLRVNILVYRDGQTEVHKLETR